MRTEAEFWNAVELPDFIGTDECWIWQRGKDRDGYGHIRWPIKTTQCHRIAYELTIGKIPEGMQVCHSCDNPACVNPSHLWLGSHAQNMKDMQQKGRRIGKTRGEENGRSIISTEQAIELRSLHNKLSRNELSLRYKISLGAVDHILYNGTWKHLLD